MSAELDQLMRAINKKFTRQQKTFEKQLSSLELSLSATEIRLKTRQDELASLRVENEQLRQTVTSQAKLISEMDAELLQHSIAMPAVRRETLLNVSRRSARAIAEKGVNTECWSDIVEKELRQRLQAFVKLYNDEELRSRNRFV